MKIKKLYKRIKREIFKNNPVTDQRVGVMCKNIKGLTGEETGLIDLVSPYTMTSQERLISLIDSLKYISANGIKGDIVECGVWKGGSSMAIAAYLLKQDITDKRLYLYDTFEGMPPPSTNDIDHQGVSASKLLIESNKESSLIWAFSPLEEVKNNMKSTGYPERNIFYVKGKVEETLKDHQHDKIALLRLDTDWYSSTKVELEVLFPKLVKGGILIIDDYGHWQGAQKAVDEYFEYNKNQIFLHRIDYTGRIAVKQA